MSISYEGTVDEKFSVVGGVTTIVKQLKYIIQSPHHARHIQADIENIPTILTPYPEDGFGNLLLKSIVPNLLKGEWLRGVWIVVLTYNDNPDDIEALLVDKTLLPWERKPTNISSGSRSYTENFAVAHPATGEGIQTKREVTNATITFSYNVRDFNYAWIGNLVNTVNSGAVYVLGASYGSGTCVLSALSVSKEFEYSLDGTPVDYYNLTVTIENYGKTVENLVPLMGFNIESGVHCHVDADGVYGLPRWEYSNEREDYTYIVSRTEWVDGEVIPAEPPYWEDNVMIFPEPTTAPPTSINVEQEVTGSRYVLDEDGQQLKIWHTKPIGSRIFISGGGTPAQYDALIDDSYYGNFPTKIVASWGTLSLPREDR